MSDDLAFAGPDVDFPEHRWGRARNRNISKSVRRKVFARDRGRCRYCGCQTNSQWLQDHPSIDHIVPRSRGGSNHIGNLVLACRRCDHTKADRTPDEAGMTLLDPGTLVVYPRNRRRTAS